METPVIILESSPIAQQLFKNAANKGDVLVIFPGFPALQYPRGILATLEEEPFFAESRAPGKTTVVLSNRDTANVPIGSLFNLQTGKPFELSP